MYTMKSYQGALAPTTAALACAATPTTTATNPFAAAAAAAASAATAAAMQVMMSSALPVAPAPAATHLAESLTLTLMGSPTVACEALEEQAGMTFVAYFDGEQDDDFGKFTLHIPKDIGIELAGFSKALCDDETELILNENYEVNLGGTDMYSTDWNSSLQLFNGWEKKGRLKAWGKLDADAMLIVHHVEGRNVASVVYKDHFASVRGDLLHFTGGALHMSIAKSWVIFASTGGTVHCVMKKSLLKQEDGKAKVTKLRGFENLRAVTLFNDGFLVQDANGIYRLQMDGDVVHLPQVMAGSQKFISTHGSINCMTQVSDDHVFMIMMNQQHTFFLWNTTTGTFSRVKVITKKSLALGKGFDIKFPITDCKARRTAKGIELDFILGGYVETAVLQQMQTSSLTEKRKALQDTVDDASECASAPKKRMRAAKANRVLT